MSNDASEERYGSKLRGLTPFLMGLLLAIAGVSWSSNQVAANECNDKVCNNSTKACVDPDPEPPIRVHCEGGSNCEETTPCIPD